MLPFFQLSKVCPASLCSCEQMISNHTSENITHQKGVWYWASKFFQEMVYPCIKERQHTSKNSDKVEPPLWPSSSLSVPPPPCQVLIAAFLLALLSPPTEKTHNDHIFFFLWFFSRSPFLDGKYEYLCVCGGMV